MDHAADAPAGELKRKSPAGDASQHPQAPPAKAVKTHNHLQINYLARHNSDDLALASNHDTMPEIIDLLSHYHGVLERHESLACNLGARPLGPILIKRFERLFDGPPKVLKSHGKDGATVTWLDVVEFARNKPDQFNLGQMSEGLKVCQFYTKQCRVQISEEDFVLISSGIPQKMIPPQPIMEDEEKELGTLEILEDRLSKICQLADQVAARTRQLNHRIKGRKQAILDRRATEPAISVRPSSPSTVAMMNGNAPAATAGFVAVNARPPVEANGSEHGKNGASSQTRQELMNRFHTLSDRRSEVVNGDVPRQRGSISGPVPSAASASAAAAAGAGSDSELAALLLASNNASTQPPHTPSAPVPTTPSATQYHHHTTGSPSQPQGQAPSQPQPASARPVEKEKPDDGPFKTEMVARMEGLGKGDRVMPPCDRCRRLHMDCLKNLTACMGCTKKHAKCSWREVKEDELLRTAGSVRSSIDVSAGQGYVPGGSIDTSMHMNVQSPTFESSGYTRPPLSSASSAAPPSSVEYSGHGSYGQQQSASAVEGPDENSVDASLRELAGFAEAAMTTASARNHAQHDRARSEADSQYREATNDISERDPGGRDAYLYQLGNVQNRVAAYEHNQQQSPKYVSHSADAADDKDMVRRRADEIPSRDVDMANTDSSKESAEEIMRRRLMRAQQAQDHSPHHSPSPLSAGAASASVDKSGPQEHQHESSAPTYVPATGASREASTNGEAQQERPAETARMGQHVAAS